MGMVMDEASRQDLASVSYSGAIAHYTQQKDAFLQEYQKQANNLNNELVDQYLSEAFAEIAANPVEGQEAIIRKLIGNVSGAIWEKLKNDKARVKQLRNDFQNKYENDIEKAKQAFREEAENLLTAEELYEMIEKNLLAVGTAEELQGFDTHDLFNQMRSFSVRVVLNKVRGKRSNTGQKYYIQSAKGFVREAVVHKAFVQFLQHLDEGDKYVMHTGGKKVENAETALDEFISFFKNIDEAYETTARFSSGEVLPTYQGYGIQSKSWIAPWETKNKYSGVHGYGIGNRQKLLNSLKSEENGVINWHDWTKCINFLARTNNTIAALGANILYVTGKNIYWTSELIGKMHENNYFLTFNFSRKNHAATAYVKWDTPSDD